MGPTQADDQSDRFFESEIRPILVEHCIACHGESEQSGGLRLDSQPALIQGGESGPIAGADTTDSLLLEAVRRSDNIAMPPDQPLDPPQVAAIAEWVGMGMPWPESSSQLQSAAMENAKDHWAFQSVKNPPVPDIEETSTSTHSPSANVEQSKGRAKQHPSTNPIDAFVSRKLAEAGLASSPESDRRTLIRRLSFTLTGLPPSSADVEQFVASSSSDAYPDLVDRYLASKQYGEHWARHWLDVARYSDTKGYVYAREERFWVHAWRYRDWVVNALNQDMAYDRFLLLQLAADQVESKRQEDLAAMGFLTVGRRFLGVNRDIIDDRIDVVTRGTLGLTVSCARCHDHKYDPIPTADYYSLYGVFNSCEEQLVSLDRSAASESEADDAFDAELHQRETAFQQKLQSSRDEASQRARSRVRDYLHAQTELDKYPPKGFDQIFEASDLLPAFVRRWEAYLRTADRQRDPVFVPWHLFSQLPADQFAEQARSVCDAITAATPVQINPRVAALFETPPTDFIEVINRYGQLLAEVAADEPNQNDPAEQQLWQVMFGPASPSQVPDEGIVHTEIYFDSSTTTALWKLQGEIDRWLIRPSQPPGYALILKDRPVPSEPRIFRRGNILTQGDNVSRQFLAVLSPPDRQPFQVGSGRLELARNIIDESNPLTARVIVNRVWAHHFGAGLVTTPSDFGLRAERPSHPELLDWLTHWFVQEGWSLKKLHRLILTSSAFRQSSFGPSSEAELQRALEVDPENRLLWRMNSRRLTFEQFRDSMLAATGEIDLRTGGKPTDLFQDTSNVRRTLYGLVDRQFLPAILRVFDFANPDLHVPRRSQTTVPQQALFFMNHPLVLKRSQQLASVCREGAEPRQAIEQMFQRVLQRAATEAEVTDALQVASQAATESTPVRPTVADWSYGHGKYDEEVQRVPDFKSLPHFTGQSWQGGPSWPDGKLGWVQLSAVGGHPGNTRSTASVRRWTAPDKMTVRIESELRHQVAAGDGVRGFIVSSEQGQLGAAKVHQSSAILNAQAIEVQKGETIDFVVDIDSVLNSDQFLWKATITDVTETVTVTAGPGKASVKASDRSPDSETKTEAGDATVWNSEADFPTNAANRLTPLEQLAQILFCSNEFLFVD
ncbi:PSD1 and planctomycete cytochrome C domain-containing protein [Rhodopirellula sp. P2]|nr:PSD1 and planctomycete cytochrome C domain-containing protein [Rhodopirellula sp. P2]WDQ14884.1 PSD1 and planctomycete cytochrome C domain-containing protein [Rhodopirellula sp. P2]